MNRDRIVLERIERNRRIDFFSPPLLFAVADFAITLPSLMSLHPHSDSELFGHTQLQTGVSSRSGPSPCGSITHTHTHTAPAHTTHTHSATAPTTHTTHPTDSTPPPTRRQHQPPPPPPPHTHTHTHTHTHSHSKHIPTF